MYSLSANFCLWWRWMSHCILAWCRRSLFLGWNLCYILLLRWNQYVKALGPLWVEQDIFAMRDWVAYKHGIIPGSHTHWWRRAAMYPGLTFCSAKLSLPWSCLSMMSIEEMYQWRAGLGSSWVAHVLFSVRVPDSASHLHLLYRTFELMFFAATCYGARQLSVDSLWVKALDHAVVGCFFPCHVSGHLAGGCLGSWRAPPWFLAVAVHPWSRHSFSNHAPECLTGFTCKKGFAPIRELCTDFHFSSTDDGLTGPGYIDQLACEQKKNCICTDCVSLCRRTGNFLCIGRVLTGKLASYKVIYRGDKLVMVRCL